MNVAAIPEFVTLWLAVNVGAFLVLAVLSYLGSGFVLDRLEQADRWMYAREHEHKFGTESKASQDIPVTEQREARQSANSCHDD